MVYGAILWYVHVTLDDTRYSCCMAFICIALRSGSVVLCWGVLCHVAWCWSMLYCVTATEQMTPDCMTPYSDTVACWLSHLSLVSCPSSESVGIAAGCNLPKCSYASLSSCILSDLLMIPLYTCKVGSCDQNWNKANVQSFPSDCAWGFHETLQGSMESSGWISALCPTKVVLGYTNCTKLWDMQCWWNGSLDSALSSGIVLLLADASDVLHACWKQSVVVIEAVCTDKSATFGRFFLYKSFDLFFGFHYDAFEA